MRQHSPTANWWVALDIDPTFPSQLSVPAHPVVPHGADGRARLPAHGLDPACCYRPVPSPIYQCPNRGNTALPGGPPRKYRLGEASAELRRQSSDGPGTVVESANIGSGAVPTRTWCIWSPASSMAPAGRQRFRPTCGNRRDSPHLAGRIFKRRLASNRTSSETLHSCRVAPRNLRKIAA